MVRDHPPVNHGLWGVFNRNGGWDRINYSCLVINRCNIYNIHIPIHIHEITIFHCYPINPWPLGPLGAGGSRGPLVALAGRGWLSALPTTPGRLGPWWSCLADDVVFPVAKWKITHGDHYGKMVIKMVENVFTVNGLKWWNRGFKSF